MVARGAVTRAAAALAAAVLAAGAAADERPAGRGPDVPALFIGTAEVEAAPGATVDGPLDVTLVLNPGAAAKTRSLRDWFPGASAAGGQVSVPLPGRAPPAHAPPAAAQHGPTFFVDYDQPGAAGFRAALASRLGAAPADADLARFVDGWIARKTMNRGLDGAARVASRREGDCTEHAVLLAAAARLAGRASRVVIGIALIPLGGTLAGFGHAWAEIHDGEAWRTVDASPLPAGVRYLPLAVLDEGPGQLAAAWGALSPVDVRKVRIVAFGSGGNRTPRTPRSLRRSLTRLRLRSPSPRRRARYFFSSFCLSRSPSVPKPFPPPFGATERM